MNDFINCHIRGWILSNLIVLKNLFNLGFSSNSIKKFLYAIKKLNTNSHINYYLNFINVFLCKKNNFLMTKYLMKLDRCRMSNSDGAIFKPNINISLDPTGSNSNPIHPYPFSRTRSFCFHRKKEARRNRRWSVWWRRKKSSRN